MSLWAVHMSGRDSERIPALVAWLGYGGLIPFVGLAIAGGNLRAVALTQAMLAYGAVILSFVGALHWGFAMAVPGLDVRVRSRLFVWSVWPALLAWVCLLLPPLVASLGLIAGLLLHYGWDRRLPFLAQLPAWYLPLRLRLTAIACISLAVNAFWLWRS
jgi:hypothetical protein